MKFKAKTNELAKVLQQVSAIIIAFPTRPIIANVMFNLSGNKLELISCDYQNMMVTSVEVEGIEDGKEVFDGKLLLNILKSTVDPQIELNKMGNTMKLVLTSGSYEFPLFDTKDFTPTPSIDLTNTVEMKSNTLLEAIRKTAHTISDDSATSTGFLLMRFEGLIARFVSTIGHIVSEYVANVSSDKFVDLLISKKSIAALKPLLIGEFVNVSYDDTKVVFQTETTTFYCVQGVGVFVNYQPLIPKDFNEYLVVDRSLFLGALKRILLVANAQSRHIKLHTGTANVRIECKDNEQNRAANESIPATNTGPNMSIGFDAKYLVDILSAYDSESIRLRITNSVRPGIFRPDDNDDYTVIIAPLNL